ncbi:DUF4276 family protein [Rhizobium leguminosarum]|uniref:DUF4276 family protein n=1 Tax=Rhizobium leguminosarum TaxID=384 RepID=UPI001031169C|nr:DUF4276 family protein [Rhizobium leguminosarum]TAY15438.1 DUF4276 family protein [Rhizobium leguminosarum]
MARLLVHVEGQTEEEFVNSVVAPHLYEVGFTSVSARLVGAARSRKRRGGICGWPTARYEIFKHLSGDFGTYSTTIVDFYALPAGDEDGWPGRNTCGHLSVALKAKHVEQSMKADLTAQHTTNISSRFVPYVAMHEFEALLFSHPERMASAFGRPDLTPRFQEIRDGYETPEHINDSPVTAPSKRILTIIPGYQKILYGNIAAIDVTLETMRENCLGFDRWLSSLEAIP